MKIEYITNKNSLSNIIKNDLQIYYMKMIATKKKFIIANKYQLDKYQLFNTTYERIDKLQYTQCQCGSIFEYDQLNYGLYCYNCGKDKQNGFFIIDNSINPSSLNKHYVPNITCEGWIDYILKYKNIIPPKIEKMIMEEYDK